MKIIFFSLVLTTSLMASDEKLCEKMNLNWKDSLSCIKQNQVPNERHFTVVLNYIIDNEVSKDEYEKIKLKFANLNLVLGPKQCKVALPVSDMFIEPCIEHSNFSEIRDIVVGLDGYHTLQALLISAFDNRKSEELSLSQCFELLDLYPPIHSYQDLKDNIIQSCDELAEGLSKKEVEKQLHHYLSKNDGEFNITQTTVSELINLESTFSNQQFTPGNQGIKSDIWP